MQKSLEARQLSRSDNFGRYRSQGVHLLHPLCVSFRTQDFEMGIGMDTMRKMPRWQADELIRPETLRPGAEKQQLRSWEEAEMELVFAPFRPFRECMPCMGIRNLCPFLDMRLGAHGQRQRFQPRTLRWNAIRRPP